MVAKTSPSEREIAHLARLHANCIELIQRGKRSPEMTKALSRALQLFKENRLGQVVASEVSKERQRRRRRFYAELNRFNRPNGDAPIGELELSPVASATLFNRFPGQGTLRELLAHSYDWLCDRISPEVTDELVELLNKHGLYLGMPLDEIDEALGPKPSQE